MEKSYDCPIKGGRRVEKRSDRTYQIILRFDKNSESDMQVYEMLQKRDKRKYSGKCRTASNMPGYPGTVGGVSGQK